MAKVGDVTIRIDRPVEPFGPAFDAAVKKAAERVREQTERQIFATGTTTSAKGLPPLLHPSEVVIPMAQTREQIENDGARLVDPEGNEIASPPERARAERIQDIASNLSSGWPTVAAEMIVTLMEKVEELEGNQRRLEAYQLGELEELV